MRRLVSILFIFSLTYSFADTLRSLHLEKFDANYADSLVFDQVNKQRLKLGKAKIYKSESLADRALSHSKLMSEQSRLSYSEDRVGQCVLSIMLPLKSVVTYQDLAFLMVQKWMLSPGHKKLLMGEFFVYGGGGTVITEKTEGHYIVMSTFQVSYKE